MVEVECAMGEAMRGRGEVAGARGAMVVMVVMENKGGWGVMKQK